MPKTPAIRYENLFRYINKFKPKSILEIGTWNGIHAKQMIEAAQHFHTEVKYIGFDLFEYITQTEILHEQSKPVKADYNSVRQLLEKIPGTDIELYVGYTKDTIPLIPSQPIDLIFVDGGHSLDTINTDWNNIQRFIHSKSIILFDDYWENREDAGCKLLINYLQTCAEWSVALLNPVDVFPEKRIRMVKVMRKF